ncbi:MAG: hypothetical protein ACFFC6_08210 [Promethearchaeota archaeon]
MSEETGESLSEIKASLEMVFNNIRTMKREVLYVNQKLSNLDSTIEAFEEFSSKFKETEEVISSLKTGIQELGPLSNEIQELKQSLTQLQQSLNEQTTKQETILTPLNETITTIQSKLSTVDQELSKISALEESITKLNQTYQESNASLSQQESKISDIQANFSTLKNNQEVNSANLQKLEAGFNEYKTTTEEKFYQLMDDSLRKSINEFESKVDGLNAHMTKVESKFEETITNVTKVGIDLEEIRTNIANYLDQVENVKTSTSGFVNRIQNLEEKAGISTGELIGTGFDNLGMLQQLVTDLLGREKVDQHIPKEVGQEPVKVIRGLKGIIRDLSCIDESNSMNTSEIMLNYSETADGKADRRTLIVNFNKDVQRVLEIGQSVLMDIGLKRMQTRNIIEEIRNLARQWTSEEDLKGELGVFMALDLLETLEREF